MSSEKNSEPTRYTGAVSYTKEEITEPLRNHKHNGVIEQRALLMWVTVAWEAGVWCFLVNQAKSKYFGSRQPICKMFSPFSCSDISFGILCYSKGMYSYLQLVYLWVEEWWGGPEDLLF